MKTYILLIVAVLFSNFNYAQCDQELFEMLENTSNNASILKKYAVTVRERKDLPFTMEYTYVFTKGKSYGFNLQHAESSKGVLGFTLSDGDGNVLNSVLKTDKTINGHLQVFECLQTGIYYFTLHTKQSFDGCAVLQLTLLEDKTKQPCDIHLFSQLQEGKDGQNVLKLYSIEIGPGAAHSYVFSKNGFYNFYIPKKTKDINFLNFQFLDATKKDISGNLNKKETEEGINFTFECRNTGIYYMIFKFAGKEKQCTVVQLSKRTSASF